ncbi:MAG: NUDIX domain-containing protein [Spirochaetia bacterium]|nr:NUDIX domain-containing protein [Spirochaetia bacterium]
MVALKRTLYFIRKKEAGEWSGGLWEFPTIHFRPEDRPEKILENYFLSEWGLKVRAKAQIASLTHTVTHHRIALCVYSLGLAGTQSHSQKSATTRWLDLKGLHKMAFPAAQKKILLSLPLP